MCQGHPGSTNSTMASRDRQIAPVLCAAGSLGLKDILPGSWVLFFVRAEKGSRWMDKKPYTRIHQVVGVYFKNKYIYICIYTGVYHKSNGFNHPNCWRQCMCLSHQWDQGRVWPLLVARAILQKHPTIIQLAVWQCKHMCMYLKKNKHSPLPSFQAEQMLVTRSVSQTFRILDILKMFTTLNDFVDLQRNFPLRNKWYRFEP